MAMVTMKQFRQHEAARDGVTEAAIAMRIKRGNYDIKVKRKNARVVFVIGRPKLAFKQ